MKVKDRFAAWIAAEGWSQEKAALELKCSQSMVSFLCQGRRVPKLQLAARIAKRSGDAVPMNAWVVDDAEPRRRAKRAA